MRALIHFQRLSEPANDQDISLEEYFTEDYDLQGRDVGVVKDMSTKIRKFKVNYRRSNTSSQKRMIENTCS